MSDPILKRRGYVQASLEDAKVSPSILIGLQSAMAVTDISMDYIADTIKFYGYSPQFDEVNSYTQAPRYDWRIGSDDKSVTYTRSTK